MLTVHDKQGEFVVVAGEWVRAHDGPVEEGPEVRDEADGVAGDELVPDGGDLGGGGVGALLGRGSGVMGVGVMGGGESEGEGEGEEEEEVEEVHVEWSGVVEGVTE